MTSWADLTIVHATQKVKGFRLETDWLEIGRALKNLSNRMKPEPYKKLLRAIDLSDRTAFYLIAIVTRLDAQEIKVPGNIGWRKLAEVAPILTYENQMIIFNKVFSHTREELIKMRQDGTLAKEG